MKQIDDLYQQLVAKTGEFENISSRLHHQEDSQSTTEESLLSAQKQVCVDVLHCILYS